MKTSSYTKFGANYNKDTGLVDFKLFSKNGTAAILCIFDTPKGKDAVLNLKMVKSSPENFKGNVFEASFDPKILGFNTSDDLQDILFYYGYRVFGPNYEYTEGWAPGVKDGFKTRLDDKNHRFNPNKLAYDPYSRELSHLHSDVSKDLSEFRSDKKLFFTDNALIAPKTVFKIIPEREIADVSPRALTDEIIGEVHIKSLTMLQNVENKGTYKAAGEFAANLKALGVTMVEFLPLQEFDDKEDIGNYWGYMPLAYFAPHKKYSFNASDGEAVAEFREMIDALHREDIKVCMDVVYNHTGEARIYNNDPTDVNLFCYALIDNREYYKSNDKGYYAINSGCHNDANTAKDGFRHIITDSLEYWINQGVDAFRFDLATSLMDTDTGVNVNYDKNKSIIGRMKEKLEARGIKVNAPNEVQDKNFKGRVVNLIAEPWTCGGYNAYQLGNFPEFFAEWNDVSRNTIRAFSVRPKSVDFLAIRHILTGSPHKFGSLNRSLNFVSCHDGFTLWDLNSYDKKAADTCGGSDWELCSSYGGNKILRDKAIRNEMALLALSAGCFMVQVDDMVLHSKGGNNNSYNIDGPVNYIDFNIPEEKRGLCDFIRNLTDFRKKHKIFDNESYVKNMEFYGHLARPFPSYSPFWTLPDMNFMSFMSNDGDETLFAAMNKGHNPVKFILPREVLKKGKNFYVVFDTKNNDFNPDGVLYEPVGEEPDYTIEPHTIVLMLVK